MEDPVFKQKYQNYKLRVKLWEKDFRKKNGRIPSKYDIREASQEVRDSYKMYYKLKTSFLESTLNDVLSDDGFDIMEMSQTAVNINTSPNENNTGPLIPSDITKLVDQKQLTDYSNCPEENSSNSNGKKSLESSVLTNLANRPQTQVIKEFEPVEVLSLNHNSWGPNLSMKAKTKEPSVIPPKSQKLNFKEKLFKNSSFSKRNPRKSFSKSSLDSTLRCQNNVSETFHSSNKEVLPDLEIILLQKAKEQQSINVSNPLLSIEKSKENIKTQLNEGWLDRNAAQNDFKSNAHLPKEEHKVEHKNITTSKLSTKSVYGLKNLDVSKLQTNSIPLAEKEQEELYSTRNINSNLNKVIEKSELKIQKTNLVDIKKNQSKSKNHDSDSLVDDSEEEKEILEYRHIMKRRKVETSKLQEEETNFCHVSETISETGVENTDSNVFAKNEAECNRKKTKRKSNCVAKRKKSTNLKSSVKRTRNIVRKEECENLTEEESKCKPPNPDDLKYSMALELTDLTLVPRIQQTEIDRADCLARKYITSTACLPGTASKFMPVTAAEEKRALDRQKLEKKIATGKLNENFVTINIQKKKFVRGKKTVNYSKYKKKIWTHKKNIAALSGPNMDMRGCDGGTLKCFNCGQAGHFAQNCKARADSLLPLTAQLEEDPSPFPTLQEAERMASNSSVAVHSRNIGKMPQAPNTAIYNETEVVEENLSSPNINDDNVISIRTEEESMESDNELMNFDIDSAISKSQKNILPVKKYVASKIPSEFLKTAGLDSNNTSHFREVGPLYDLNADGNVKEVTPEVLEALRMFGHTNFRKGQDRAVMRILSGMSTLVTLSTGSGKSLCYQLPAYLYSKHKKAITLVISPLVSLMEDQVTGVPHFLRAHCLHTNQSSQQKMKIMQMISDGEIDVLLVSPEAVVAGERSTGFGSILRQLPPIAFACIDEAHCVSQWSHNFRPSYLMICKVLKQNLGVKCVLGLTATATFPTRISIINHLGIMDGERGIISDIPLPDNLILSVSKDENRDSALLQLLLSKRFENCQSIIVYCIRRDECERIAGYLRTSLQDCKVPIQENGKKKRKRVNWHAEPYHAGMPASRRRTIQNAFMNNELRIVVATIAFGMGINKPDIRAVIHYNMPRNFESYVQEVGRAGRDNNISHCHLFLDSNGGDQNELKRHIYANSLDRHVIRKLLQNVFVSCSCAKNVKSDTLKSSKMYDNTSNKLNSDDNVNNEDRQHICQGHEIGFSIEKTVEALDIPEENISTLLCYMELDNRWCINVLSNAYIKAKIISYGGPKYLKHAAKECPPLAMAIAMEIKKGTFKEDANIIEFSVIDVAAAIGWNSGVVKYQLKNLEWIQENGYPKRSPITVSLYDLGFRIKAPGDFTAEEIDDALDALYKRSVKQEQTQLIQLQYIFQGLSSVAYNSYGPCCNEIFSNDRSDQLKAIIRDYFQNDYPKNMKLAINASNVSDEELVSDVIGLINIYPENNFSGRTIARIFHGISSPNYPALMWYRCKFWRLHSKTDFNRIVQLANNAIVKRRI